MKTINKENWIRKEYFDFFSKYDNPFFGLVTEIDCTKAYRKCKDQKLSFFSYYLHKSILAVNRIEELKYRINGKDVVKFEQIHASSTVGRADGTFGFSFVNFSEDFDVFDKELKQEIEEVQNTNGLRLNENVYRLDTIHYSTLPWHKFTGLTHARSFNNADSSPKITIGKAFTIEGKMMLPVSIDAHHGLVDGIHVSQFLNEFQKFMDE